MSRISNTFVKKWQFLKKRPILRNFLRHCLLTTMRNAGILLPSTGQPKEVSNDQRRSVRSPVRGRFQNDCHAGSRRHHQGQSHADQGRGIYARGHRCRYARSSLHVRGSPNRLRRRPPRRQGQDTACADRRGTRKSSEIDFRTSSFDNRSTHGGSASSNGHNVNGR